ncbi:hypothetical protein BDA96_10G126400, partial [Sorghum bicolor]
VAILRLASSFSRLPPPVLLLFPCAHRSFSPTLAACPLSRRRTLLLFSSFGIRPLSCYRGASFVAMAAAPPVAKKVPHQLVEHGDIHVDNYYWLRDDSRSDPD